MRPSGIAAFFTFLLGLVGSLARLAAAQPAGVLVRDPQARIELSAPLATRLAVCTLAPSAPAAAGKDWARVRYLVLDPGKSDAVIVDRIDGHTVRLAENTVEKIRFVFAYHQAGGNQYAVTVYVFADHQLLRLRDQPPSSNMRSLAIDGRFLVVENEETDKNGDRAIVATRFDLLSAQTHGGR